VHAQTARAAGTDHLVLSDGCRPINRVVVRGVPYAYPRYFFANESRDILQIMADSLDSVGVAWRYNRPNSISIARREAVWPWTRMSARRADGADCRSWLDT
jgi:hypothetical protein